MQFTHCASHERILFVSPRFIGEKANGSINDPLGLTVAPNGNILTTNGNNGKLVETTPSGTQVAHKFIDTSGSPPGAGCLFGLAIVPDGSGLYFVDDCTNTLNLFS
jgi:hypothetical protein